MVTDTYLLTIPLPMLWAANLKPFKKIGLMILFSGGIFVIACAILRCVLIVTVSFPVVIPWFDTQLIADERYSIGSYQRRPTSWLLGCPRNFRCRRHHESSDDIPTYKTSSRPLH